MASLYFHWLVSLSAPRVSQDLATYLESSLLCHLSNNEEEDDNNKNNGDDDNHNNTQADSLTSEVSKGWVGEPD